MSNDSEQTTKLAIWIARLIPLPALVGGAFMLYSGVKEIYLAKESVTWPSAEGTIQSSMVKRSESTSKKRLTYRAEVVYRFTAEGQLRTSDKIAFGTSKSSYAYVEDVVNRYPTGATVKVYYRVNSPATCILQPGLQHGQFWFLPSFGLFLFLSMGLLAILLPIAIRNKEEKVRRGRVPARVVTGLNPPRSISLRKDGHMLELTLCKKRLALLVSFLAVLLGPILFIYVGFAVKGVPIIFGIVGVIFLAIVIIGYTQALLAAETIRVGLEKIEIRQFRLWAGTCSEVVHAKDIKGVTVEKADNTWSIRIAIQEAETGEEMFTSFGARSWVSFETAEWIRNCILQVLPMGNASLKRQRATKREGG